LFCLCGERMTRSFPFLSCSLQADIEKRPGNRYAPQMGRTMVLFVDDISMPEVRMRTHARHPRIYTKYRAL
jgi:hypothetical protein